LTALDRRKGNSGRKPKVRPHPAPFLRLVETAPVELEPTLFPLKAPARLGEYQGGVMPPGIAAQVRFYQRQ